MACQCKEADGRDANVAWDIALYYLCVYDEMERKEAWALRILYTLLYGIEGNVPA